MPNKRSENIIWWFKQFKFIQVKPI
jgi:hypothetical protein